MKDAGKKVGKRATAKPKILIEYERGFTVFWYQNFFKKELSPRELAHQAFLAGAIYEANRKAHLDGLVEQNLGEDN